MRFKYKHKRTLLFLLLINFFFTIQAQSNEDFLINNIFSAVIDEICEEGEEGYDSSNTYIYLTLNFSKEHISIIETSTYYSDSGDVTFKADYKWVLAQDNEIKIYSNTEEINYKFLEGFILKIEGKKVIGYKTKSTKKVEEFIFKLTG